MKTKTEYEKLECDFWNLSELKEPFEKGELYHKVTDRYFKVKERADLSLNAIVDSSIYKRVETEVTLDDDLQEIGMVELGFTIEFIFDDGKLGVYYDDLYQVGLKPETIHKLSEILKRHGK